MAYIPHQENIFHSNHFENNYRNSKKPQVYIFAVIADRLNLLACILLRLTWNTLSWVSEVIIFCEKERARGPGNTNVKREGK